MHVARDAGILWLTFDRPQKKNAFTGEMYTALADALNAANTDPDIQVIALKGSGGAFTAGNDLTDFLETPPRDDSAPVFRFLYALTALDKPLLAGVEGPAIGIGTTMLLHCDVVIAAENAKFALPFVNLGLSPEGASSLLLPGSAGWALACELLLFGEPFDALTAQRAGLVSRIVPPAELEAVLQERARALVQKPLASLLATKRLLRRQTRAHVQEALRLEGNEFLERLRSPEAREAFTAFRERRAPDFAKLKRG